MPKTWHSLSHPYCRARSSQESLSPRVTYVLESGEQFVPNDKVIVIPRRLVSSFAELHCKSLDNSYPQYLSYSPIPNLWLPSRSGEQSETSSQRAVEWQYL